MGRPTISGAKVGVFRWRDCTGRVFAWWPRTAWRKVWDLRRIGRLPDEQVVEQLTQVKGIGRWTAQMFLIFSLGRPDVFPHDDLGVRTAIRNRYGLAELPDKATSHAIAAPWRPYASVASWYCWRSLDLARNTSTVAKGYPS